MRMRIVATILGAVLSIFGVQFLLFSPAAQADDPNSCAAGRVCVWGENSYTGCRKNMAVDTISYANHMWDNCYASINNGINSLTNRDSICKVAFYDGGAMTGAGLLFNSPYYGAPYQDPNLSNGGGFGIGGGSNTANWQDRFSSHNHCP